MSRNHLVCVACGFLAGLFAFLLLTGGGKNSAYAQPPAGVGQVGRYQLSAWAHTGYVSDRADYGAYVLDTQTGDVYGVHKQDKEVTRLGQAGGK